MATRVRWGDAIAIIGAGCRLPGGITDLDSLDRLLRAGVDAIEEIPLDRWSMPAFASETAGVPGKTYSRWGGFLANIDQFEPEAFGISPREAAVMDPQQRLLLEVTWDALQDASIPQSEIAGGRTGVFVGISTFDYAQLQSAPWSKRSLQSFTALGTSLGIAANRLSYCLDVHGPSFIVDTACSSSLVALDRAVKSLQSGECDTAIVGGVNVLLLPDVFISFCAASMLAPDGRSKAFDASADGFVPAEGAAAVVLRTAQHARARGDRVHALILGSGINQDGRTAGLAMPNRESQIELLRQVYGAIRLDPALVSYVEAHGTGTAIGDRVEAHALGEVFGPGRNGHPLVIGSIKTNIGHLEAASGIAALLKTTLSLKRRTIYRNLHFRQPNPRIPFEGLKLRVPTDTEPWPLHGAPVAGVNSFGFGGTNAHAVLAANEFLPVPRRPLFTHQAPASRPFVLPITARSDSALAEMTQAFRDALPETAAQLSGFCRTAAVRRTHYAHRVCVVGATGEELRLRLQAFVEGQPAPGLSAGVVKAGNTQLVFVFCGQGPQYPGMAVALMECEPVFRDMVRRCDAILAPHLGWSVLAKIRRAAHSRDIDQTRLAQPALFTVQAGLTALWQSWGVKPGTVIGHSVGEVAAAWASGALTLEDACRVVASRSRAMQDAPGGGKMLAAALTADEARERLARFGSDVSLAAINAPKQVTFSGEPRAIGSLAADLERDRIWNQLLRVSHAFHSQAMDSAEAPLRAALKGLSLARPLLRFISTVTGCEVRAETLNDDYWWRNVRQPVLFGPAVEAVLQQGHAIFLEIGPHPVMTSAVKEMARALGAPAEVWPSLKRDAPDAATILTALGNLFTRGAPIDWNAVLPGSSEPVDLPPHPWRRQRYWSENPEIAAVRLAPRYHPLLGFRRTSSAPVWEQTLDTKAFPWLAEHRVKGSEVVPGAAFIELMLAALADARDLERGRTIPALCLENIQFQRALFLSGGSSASLQVALSQGDHSVSIYSRPSGVGDGAWVRNAAADWSTANPPRPEPIELAALRARCNVPVTSEELYAEFRHFGLEHGPVFQTARELWRNNHDEALARIEIDSTLTASLTGYWLHPTVLDACFQLSSVPAPKEARNSLKLPVRVDRIHVWQPARSEVWCHFTLQHANEWAGAGDIRIYDREGNLLAEVLGFSVLRASGGVAESLRKKGPRVYSTEWKPAAVPEVAGLGGAWVLFVDAWGVAAELAGRLASSGAQIITVSPGSRFETDADRSFIVDPGDPSHFARLLKELPPHLNAVNILHLWSLDVSGPQAAAEQFDGDTVLSVHSPLFLLQALSGQRRIAPGKLAFVRNSRPNSAGLVGLGRVAASELRGWCIKLIELPDECTGADFDGLAAELLCEDQELEAAWRNGQRFVPRIQEEPSVDLHQIPRSNATAFRLESDSSGSVDTLRWFSADRRQPEAGEIEIAVTHAGLNFRDVLKCMALYPASSAEELALGDECAGVISAIGPGVTAFRAGDRVVACARGCFRSHVITRAAFALPVPAGWENSEAVTVPIAFLTAWYALYTIGHLSRAESVLIHAAAGGVGSAAVQLSQLAGARVFATAGAEEKRAMLRDLGCELVMDSRSLDFGRQIAAHTGGRGVDVVLNSLAGEALSESIGCLAPYGRFLELGKRDLFANSRIGLWPLRQNVSFHVIDLGALLQDRAELATRLLDEIGSKWSSGSIHPIQHRVCQASEISEAFRAMSQGKHIGKLVIDLCDPALHVTSREAPRVSFSHAATYVVSGGLGGFGLETARWIVRRGGKHVVLLSRRSAEAREAHAAVAELRALGGEPLALCCDVADRKQVASTIEQLRTTKPPIRGVFHAAVVIDDAPVPHLDADRLRRVLEAKALGAWNLHEETRTLEIDHFVLFSSISTAVGNPGQANYAAANAMVEALARYRRKIGLPAAAVAWGFVSDVGMAAQRSELIQAGARRGFLASTAAEYLDILERLLRLPSRDFVVGDFDWKAVGDSLFQAGHHTGLMSSLASVANDGTRLGDSRAIRDELATAPAGQREELLREYLQLQLASILGATAAKVDPNRAIVDLGLDSLMGIELATVIERDLSVTLPSLSTSRDVTVSSLAREIVAQLGCDSRQEDGGPLSDLHGPFELMKALREGGQMPLICLHPIGGDLSTYQALSDALDRDIAVYGVRSRMLGGASEYSSLDAMTTAYAAEIEKSLPAGPYCLFGFSLGGYLAASVAQRLENAGRPVQWVGIADCPDWTRPPDCGALEDFARLVVSSYEQVSADAAFLKPLRDAERLALHQISHKLILSQERGPDLLLTWLTDHHLLEGTVPLQTVRTLLQRLASHLLLFGSSPELPAVRAPLYVWLAAHGIGAGLDVWRRADGPADFCSVIEADHATLMKPPSVRTIALEINRALRGRARLAAGVGGDWR